MTVDRTTSSPHVDERASARCARRRAGAALVAVGLLGATVFVATTPAEAAQAPVGLGTATSFAVLAGSGITNTGPTTITGDVGTFPTPSETGFNTVTITGTNHVGDAVTQGAKPDLLTAYNDAAGRGPATSVPVELGGTTKLAGVYTSPTLGITGTLTLDGEGDPNAEFIFQAGSTLITASNSHVLFINGADPCNVVWQIGSSATFGTGTAFVGTVLAHTTITAKTGATFQGRLLARNGAVTLDTNTITRSACAAGGTTTTTGGGGSSSTSTTAGVGGSTTSTTAVSGTTATTGGRGQTPNGPGGSGSTPNGSTGGGTGTAGGTGRTPGLTSQTVPLLPNTGKDVLMLLSVGLALVTLGGVFLSSRRPDAV